jgi:hypothetical protein
MFVSIVSILSFVYLPSLCVCIYSFYFVLWDCKNCVVTHIQHIFPSILHSSICIYMATFCIVPTDCNWGWLGQMGW